MLNNRKNRKKVIIKIIIFVIITFFFTSVALLMRPVNEMLIIFEKIFHFEANQKKNTIWLRFGGLFA